MALVEARLQVERLQRRELRQRSQRLVPQTGAASHVEAAQLGHRSQVAQACGGGGGGGGGRLVHMPAVGMACLPASARSRMPRRVPSTP